MARANGYFGVLSWSLNAPHRGSTFYDAADAYRQHMTSVFLALNSNLTLTLKHQENNMVIGMQSTFEGNVYSIVQNIDLLNPAWNLVEDIDGAAGTNDTAHTLSIGGTQAFFGVKTSF